MPGLIIISIELIAIIFALTYTLNIQLDKHKIGFILFVIALPTTCLYIWVSFWLGIITLLLTTIILFYLFSKNIRVWLDVVILFIGGFLTTHLTQLIHHYFSREESLINTFIYALLFLLLFAIYVYAYKVLIHKFGAKLTIPKLGQLFIFMIASMTIIVFYLNIFLTTYRDNRTLVNMNLYIQLVYFLIMIILFSMLLYSVKKENQVKRKALELEQFSMYMTALEQVNRDMQKFRHDYANILLTMRGYLEHDDLANLKVYFQQHILKTEQQTLFKHQVLGHLDNLELIELKGLLATKVLQADELGIQIHVEIPETIQTINMNIIDLTRILGILMDNAIEANQPLENRKIHLALLKTNTESIIIIVQNLFEHHHMNINQLFSEHYSTKGKERGIGLAVTKKIVKNYPNVVMNTRIENGWFVQELEIR